MMLMSTCLIIADLHLIRTLQERLRQRRSLWVEAAEGDYKWLSNLDLLLEYGDEHGTCNVPYDFVCQLEGGSEVKLGVWLNNQRQYNRKGTLRAYRKARLQELVDEGRLHWSLKDRLKEAEPAEQKAVRKRAMSKSGHCNTVCESEAVDAEVHQRSKSRYVSRPSSTPVPPPRPL